MILSKSQSGTLHQGSVSSYYYKPTELPITSSFPRTAIQSTSDLTISPSTLKCDAFVTADKDRG